MARNDRHSPSNIIPTDYRCVCQYHSVLEYHDWPIPAFNVDLALKLYRESGTQIHGGIFNCDVCGAHFKEGELWQHESGEIIALGHTCAAKYDLLADKKEYQRRRKGEQKRIERLMERRAARQRMRDQLDEIPGLNRALKTDHHITRDLRANMIRFGSLTERQVALALKLEKDVAERKQREAEEAGKLIEVPEGRLEIEGTVLSAKLQDGFYGDTYKMLVRVETEDGMFKIWGTIPESIWAAQMDERGQYLPVTDLRGKTVRMRATLKKSDDLGFGFFSRPAKGEVA